MTDQAISTVICARFRRSASGFGALADDVPPPLLLIHGDADTDAVIDLGNPARISRSARMCTSRRRRAFPRRERMSERRSGHENARAQPA
jgi:hypothetical protein